MAGFDPLRGWRSAQHFDPERFRMLIEHHGAHRAGFLLGVPRLTLRRWCQNPGRIPHAAGALLWHLSAYGRTTEDIERENHRRTLHGLATALQARVAWLEAELVRQARQRDHGSANDPYAADPTDPRAGIAGRPG